jgi:ADP-heptose:LPS heptosyltransferase
MTEITQHILVIRLSAMGDVAMSVPVLRALTHHYPHLKITVLTKAFFKPIFKDIQNVSVVIADVKGKHKGVFGLYRLARQLNNTSKFYAVADLHNVLRSQLLKTFLRCRRTITLNKGRKEKQALIKGKIFQPLKTTHQRYAQVFEKLGFPIDLSKPNFPDKRILSKKSQRLLENSTQKLLGIAPFAAHKGKMYPLDLMKEVIHELSKEYKIVLFGGGDDEIQRLNAIEKAYDNVISIAGKVSFEEQIDIVSNLDVMLSMDSGNAHIAAMFGVKVITIWGVTHPFAGFAPFNQPKDYALLSDRKKYPKIPTSIFGNKCPESYLEASRSIPPETVIEKIKALI